jgi:ankyrin repeat protein
LQAAAAGGCTRINEKSLIEFVRSLSKRGPDDNAAGEEDGWKEGRIDIVRLLLENGADPHATGGEYGSALGAACAEDRARMVQLLLEQGVIRHDLIGIVCG